MTSTPDLSDMPSTQWASLPRVDLRQLHRLTDDTGMFQHALHGLPDPNHGYCIDDNARALIAAVWYVHLQDHDESAVPIDRYLAFVAYAMNTELGRFRNFMSYDRRWLEDAGSEDSHARALWSLGVAVRMAPNEGTRDLAERLFLQGLGAAREFEFVHPWAFTLLGLDPYLQARPDIDVARELQKDVAERLYKAFVDHASDDWPFPCDTLTWGNAKIPHALLVSGAALGEQDMVEMALKSLDWLARAQTAESGVFSSVGNDGWFPRGGQRAVFDQQPIETHAMVEACLAAARVTGDTEWADKALWAFDWFLGRNELGLPLYDAETGGCCDGLMPDSVNKNQGAESSLAYLLSLLDLHMYRDNRLGRVKVTPTTIGLGVVGASNFADFCLENYGPIATLKPTAVWSRTAASANALGEKRGLRVHESLNDLAKDSTVQLVHIATTPGTHAELAMPILNAGKHVLVEKPIATTTVDAQQMIQAAQQNEVQLGVNFMMRHGPLAARVGKLIETKLLGEVLRGYVVNRASDAGLPEGHWFWDERQSGGIFVEHGVHFFDLVASWLGDGVVLGASRIVRPGTDIIDQVSAEVQYGEQATVSYYHGFHQSPHFDQQEVRLIFERGQLRMSGWVAQEIEIEAALSNEQVEPVHAIFPDAEVRDVRKLEGDDRTAARRWKKEAVHRQILLSWQDPRDKQEVYGKALADLMNDLVEAIHNRSHRMRVTADQGRDALATAVEATRIAKAMSA